MTQIVVDIDSTCYDFESLAREAFMKLAVERDDPDLFRGAYAPWVEWRSAHDVCGEDIWLEVCDMVISDEVQMEQSPFPGAVETLEALAANGFDLLYLTSRRTILQEVTETWLSLYGFPCGDVHCVQGLKRPHMVDAQFLIDDRPRTLVDFVYDSEWLPGERRAFGLLYEYNRALTDLPNISLAPTWAGLNHYFVEKGLLPSPAHTTLKGIAHA